MSWNPMSWLKGAKQRLPDGTSLDPLEQDELVTLIQSVLPDYTNDQARTCLSRTGWRLAQGTRAAASAYLNLTLNLVSLHQHVYIPS